jgi:fatty acid desaturase
MAATNGKRIEWYRTPLDSMELQALTRESDGKGLAQAGGFLLVYLATASVSLLFFLRRLWVPMAIACYVHSAFFFFMSMAAAVHELSHGTAFKTKKLNDFFYKLFCFLTWNNPVHFRASHAFHHQNTVHRGIDFEVLQGPVAEKLNFRNLFFWFTFDAPWCWNLMRAAVLHSLDRTDADYFFWKPLFQKDDPKRHSMVSWARLMLAGHILLAALFASFHLWVLIYLVTFGSFFATFLGKLCGALQHTGLSENAPDWRVTCHSVEFSPLMRFLYWNMNFHIEHHMFAAVPFHNLPRLHALMAHDYPHPHPSFLAGIRKLFEIRREQKKDPSYIFVPEFPETASLVKWK